MLAWLTMLAALVVHLKVYQISVSTRTASTSLLIVEVATMATECYLLCEVALL
jgi:hypothetical protein